MCVCVCGEGVVEGSKRGGQERSALIFQVYSKPTENTLLLGEVSLGGLWFLKGEGGGEEKDNVSWGAGQTRNEVFQGRGLFMSWRREEAFSPQTEPSGVGRRAPEASGRNLNFHPVLQIQTFDIIHKWSHTHNHHIVCGYVCVCLT